MGADPAGREGAQVVDAYLLQLRRPGEGGSVSAAGLGVGEWHWELLHHKFFGCYNGFPKISLSYSFYPSTSIHRIRISLLSWLYHQKHRKPHENDRSENQTHIEGSSPIGGSGYWDIWGWLRMKEPTLGCEENTAVLLSVRNSL